MKFLCKRLLLLVTAPFLLTQLGGCDRRPVTAEQPGATNGAPKMAGSTSSAPVTTTEKMQSDKSSKN